MLAQRIELDVLDNHHLLVGLAEHGAAQDGFGVLGIALEKILHGLGHALGCLGQTLAVHILAQQPDDAPIVPGKLLGQLLVVDVAPVLQF